MFPENMTVLDPYSEIKEVISEKDIYVADLPDRKSALDFCARKMHEKIKKDISLRVFLEKVFQADETNIVLPTGLYMPHLKMPEVSRLHVVLAVLPGGAADISGEKFYICVFFVSPLKPAFFQKHLNFLSSLSSSFTRPFVERLISLRSPSEIYKAIASAKK